MSILSMDNLLEINPVNRLVVTHWQFLYVVSSSVSRRLEDLGDCWTRFLYKGHQLSAFGNQPPLNRSVRLAPVVKWISINYIRRVFPRAER
jgi:hypothetical protein